MEQGTHEVKAVHRRTSAVRSPRARRGSFVPAALLALALWGVASLPGDELQAVQVAPESALLRLLLSDPSMHALTFGLLTLLLGWGLRGRGAGRGPLAIASGWRRGCAAVVSTLPFTPVDGVETCLGRSDPLNHGLPCAVCTNQASTQS